MLLVGDIGGTHARLALYEYKKELRLIKENTFLSSNYPSLISIIQSFIKNEDVKIEAASFGVAGPVKKKKCETTNLPWIIDIAKIAEDLNITEAYLLNDMEAEAYGISCLGDSDFYILNEGDVNSTGNACILTAGTGLGEAALFFDGKNLKPFACEGGHVDFAPQNDLEIELLKFLKEKYDHVSYERILSGPGIYNLYEFLVSRGFEPGNEELEKELEKSLNPQLIITNKGVNKANKTCERVIDLFVSIYGAEAGNAALKYFAFGGVYIGGSIASFILNIMKEKKFMSSFVNKGRFEKFMMTIPVKVILNEKLALLGARQYALLIKEKVLNG